MRRLVKFVAIFSLVTFAIVITVLYYLAVDLQNFNFLIDYAFKVVWFVSVFYAVSGAISGYPKLEYKIFKDRNK